MHYLSANPAHQPFLEEIARREDFHNLGMHLPGPRAWLQWMYESSVAQKKILSADTKTLPALWKAIDAFIAQTGFDIAGFLADKERWEQDPEIFRQSQTSLCPLYVYLREKGFSEQRIIK